METNVQRLDLAEIASLTFSAPDMDRFPALALAREALLALDRHRIAAQGQMDIVARHARQFDVDLIGGLRRRRFRLWREIVGDALPYTAQWVVQLVQQAGILASGGMRAFNHDDLSRQGLNDAMVDCSTSARTGN